MSQILRALSRAALWLAAFGLIAMTAIIAWQIFGRYVLNDSPSWTEPLALLLMSWFIVLGAAVGVREGDHLGFDVGLHLAGPKTRKAMLLATHLGVCAFGVAMAVYGAELTAGTWSAKMAGVNLPQGMDYLPLAGGGALIALFSAEKAAQAWRGADLLAPPNRDSEA